MSQIYDVIIVGAGFAGLAAALEAKKNGLSFIILEADNKPGGRAQTIRTKRGDVINMGPNWDHGRRASPLFRLIQQFGLKWRMDDAQHYSIYNGKVYGPELKARFLETLEKNFAAAKEKDPDTDGPFEKYLGDDAELKDLAGFWRKVWCGSGRRNDVSTREFLSNPYGTGGIVLEDGVEALVSKLVEAVGGKKIKYSARVKSIDDNGLVTIKTADGQIYQARKTIFTGSIATLQSGHINFKQGLSEKTRRTLGQLTMGQMVKVFFPLKALPPWLENGRRIDVIDKKNPMVFHIGVAGKKMLSAIIGGSAANNIENDWKRAAKIVRRKIFRLNRIPELKGIDKLVAGKPIITAWGKARDIGGAYSCWKVGSKRRGPLRDGNIIITGEAFDRLSGHIGGAFHSGAVAIRMAMRSEPHTPRAQRPRGAARTAAL